MEDVDLYAGESGILDHRMLRMMQQCAHLLLGYMAAAANKLDGVFAGTLPEPTKEPKDPKNGSSSCPIVTTVLPENCQDK
jgi:hypothetical protein